MNLSKQLKRKRDAEARLQKQSPTPSYVGSGGNPSSGGGTIPNDEYVTIQNIINQITQVIQTQLIAGDNITITDNEDGTYTISGQAGATTEKDLLTNGDILDTELLFAEGDVIWVEV